MEIEVICQQTDRNIQHSNPYAWTQKQQKKTLKSCFEVHAGSAYIPIRLLLKVDLVFRVVRESQVT
jgi:hypothetical protein